MYACTILQLPYKVFALTTLVAVGKVDPYLALHVLLDPLIGSDWKQKH